MENNLLPEVEKKIIVLRNQQVILDADVAELYGVETKRINEAVSNNTEKFPEGYVFQVNKQEKTEVVENFDHLQKLRFSPQLPKAFTEKGLYMLATILKSPKATETTIAIVEAYAKLKELSRVIVEVPQHEDNQQIQTAGSRTCRIKGSQQKDDGLHQSIITERLNLVKLLLWQRLKTEAYDIRAFDDVDEGLGVEKAQIGFSVNDLIC